MGATMAACARAVACWFAEAPGRMGRVLTSAETGPVDTIIYVCAWFWFLTLAITPDASFLHAAHATILALKGFWVWPAVVALVGTPLGWVCHWRSVHNLSRAYAIAWWGATAFLTFFLLRSLPFVWGASLTFTVASFWLAEREAAKEIIRDQRQTG